MGKGYKHGGSGSGANPLNFTVKTYPSEVELKADKPKENTIGVITTTTMTRWVFSATEHKEPEVGMVWISVGTSSAAEFNALKKNTLQVYPLSAKQYVGGKWEEKAAYSYSNGEWVSWVTYLFEDGTAHKTLDYTGYVYESKYAKKQATISGDSIVLNNSGSLTACIIGSDEAIDLTNCSKIVVDATITNGQYFVYAATTKTIVLSAVAIWKQNNQSGEFAVDVSNLNGKHYLAISTWNNESGGSNNVKINRWGVA